MKQSDRSGLCSAWPYFLPFALFAVITYCQPLFGLALQIIYPAKTVIVACLLVWLFRYYKDEIRFQMDWPAVFVGGLVFGIWVGLEGLYPQIADNLNINAPQLAAYDSFVFLAIRLVGATLVVPLMEELFWRSLALRVLIDWDFKKIGLGQFTWFSFIAVSVAFGLEHHRWLPGIIAGAAYAGLLYRTRNLFSPILSHAVTNLLLGVYVIQGAHWQYW